MTAALSAEALDRCLREQERRCKEARNLSGFGRRFHER
jgi:hypothetical protein